MSQKLYYHFTGARLRDGRPIPPIGTWLGHKGRLACCDSGLHMSPHPFDALIHAPGPTLHLVEPGEAVIPHGEPVDQIVSNGRRIIQTIDATTLLQKFSRHCAFDVLELWEHSSIVERYLQTSEESILRDALEELGRVHSSRAVRAVVMAASCIGTFPAHEAARRVASWAVMEAVEAQNSTHAQHSVVRNEARKKQRDRLQQMVDKAFDSEKEAI